MTKIYDICVVGTGIAGTFACLRLSEQYPDAKILAIEMGRPPHKRRMQMCGWLGILPNSDGKWFKNDIERISKLVGKKEGEGCYQSVHGIINNITDYKFIKDKKPNINVIQKLKKINYNVELNDHLQMYPKEVHLFSKYVVSKIKEVDNIDFSFDNEVSELHKNSSQKTFTITTELGDFKAKKVILAAGRIGCSWINELYNKLGLVEKNDVAKFGFRMEMDAGFMKDFNGSNCSIVGNNMEIGPLSWNGTIVPEDHFDFATSAFRGNESRWKTDKVSFSFMGSQKFEGKGFEEVDRLGKLTFILTNDRIMKEKISSFLNDKSKVSILPEYKWLKEKINQFSTIVPNIINKGYMYTPTILPLAPKVKLGKDFSTEVEGLYVVGETAVGPGIMAAAMSGISVANKVLLKD